MPTHALTDSDLIRRRALVLDPSDASGWFNGTHLLCADPIVEFDDADVQSAAAVLQRVFESSTEMVAAVCIDYDGTASVRVYERPLVKQRIDREPGARAAGVDSSGDRGEPLLHDAAATMTHLDYTAAIRDAQERIVNGDLYVLNLTYRVSGRMASGPAETYRRLRQRAGSGMSALWAHPDRSFASVSPERFLGIQADGDRIRHARIEPIKGTRPRGHHPPGDAAIMEELSSCEKERAEHVMVVDMERNDLGRVCVPGSVDVHPLMEVTTTPYCHQLVSSVRGTLRAEVDLGEVLEAVFPCGSVTGAPKIAAQHVIGELETDQRGLYTGALMVAMAGELDSSVLIRTLECQGEAGTWGTGCGITVDSDPEAEWAESLLKASPVMGTATRTSGG